MNSSDLYMREPGLQALVDDILSTNSKESRKAKYLLKKLKMLRNNSYPMSQQVSGYGIN